VLTLLQQGLTYEEAGERLGVPPGQAYLVATGIPADGSDAVTVEQRRRPGMLPSRSQRLVNPNEVNPTRRDDVLDWIRSRLLADEPMRAAARDHEEV
jgi:hypothetical protein